MKVKPYIDILAITLLIFIIAMGTVIILAGDLVKFDLATLLVISAGILLLMMGEFVVYYLIMRKKKPQT